MTFSFSLGKKKNDFNQLLHFFSPTKTPHFYLCSDSEGLDVLINGPNIITKKLKIQKDHFLSSGLVPSEANISNIHAADPILFQLLRRSHRNQREVIDNERCCGNSSAGIHRLQDYPPLFTFIRDLSLTLNPTAGSGTPQPRRKLFQH